jgi:hypothetical protein
VISTALCSTQEDLESEIHEKNDEREQPRLVDDRPGQNRRARVVLQVHTLQEVGETVLRGRRACGGN